VFVAAAGNNGLSNDVYPDYPSAYDLDNIISMAATNNVDQLANFSSYGAASVDLGARDCGGHDWPRSGRR